MTRNVLAGLGLAVAGVLALGQMTMPAGGGPAMGGNGMQGNAMQGGGMRGGMPAGTMPAGAMGGMRASTVGKIVASAAEVVPLEVGASAPKLTLKGVDGKAFDLNASAAKKPTVLIFYRGGWCPYCNEQMSGLEGIEKTLTEAGYQLLAISPDKPEELAKSIDKHTLTYTLLSDSDATAIQAFGLAFRAAAAQFNLLEQYSGEEHHALPVPAVYILGMDGKVKFVHFDPDFKKRMDPAKIVEEAKRALGK